MAKERTEKELYEAKVAVMTSQIRPHFMYNALTSIAMMCTIDPETAQEATVTFAKYLRENMDSLKQTKPGPFAQELDHLKKYLYIEKLRFGKKLNIEYDIQATNFVIPLLSAQPLAENAVYQNYNEMSAGKTSVFISHRLASCRFCDRILCLDGGRIVESGSHAELMKQGGKYAGMYEMQSVWYREGGKPDEEE